MTFEQVILDKAINSILNWHTYTMSNPDWSIYESRVNDLRHYIANGLIEKMVKDESFMTKVLNKIDKSIFEDLFKKVIDKYTINDLPRKVRDKIQSDYLNDWNIVSREVTITVSEKK